jgi:adenine deaminase
VSADIIDDQYLLPGLVDAHIHIESSMLTPSEFAHLALPHGTVACVCDPHEIANVCGIPGIDFMIESGNQSPLRFFFGAPSCVPATSFETSGATLDANDIKLLLNRNSIAKKNGTPTSDELLFLGEMMNFPGVLARDEQVMLKLQAAIDAGKPIDGHAPGLSGDDLRAYVEAGISTDHECVTLNEALEKIALGMKIQIREGSAAKNFEALVPLLATHPDRVLFCSDDLHPNDLLNHGHMDVLVRRAINAGYDPMAVIRACTLNPSKHYKLSVGFLQVGDAADFIAVENLQQFKVKRTWIDGVLVAENGQTLTPRSTSLPRINAFQAKPIMAQDLRVEPTGTLMNVIVALNDQLYTPCEQVPPTIIDNNLVSNTDTDILKLVVYNRYQPSKPAIGFIKNFGLRRGALVSTVAHDCHNIVAVGTSDEMLATAINRIIETKGGILAMDENESCLLPLPIAGILSDDEGSTVAGLYEQADALAKRMGSTLHAPFMTLAFMSLAVIPELKLTDKGLFEINKLSYTNLQR